MKTAGLLIYLLTTGYVTVFVGQVLYKNGRHFLLRMLKEAEVTDAVNRILLTGYYLVNLGYVTMMLTLRQDAGTIFELISSLSNSIGRILITLGIMHYLNIAAVTLWNKLSNTKNSTI